MHAARALTMFMCIGFFFLVATTVGADPRPPFRMLVRSVEFSDDGKLLVVVITRRWNSFTDSTMGLIDVSKGKWAPVKFDMGFPGKVLTATLVDNETARDFVSLLPLNLSLNDLFGREKYGDLPKALSRNGPRKNRYEVGDVAYWSPDHQFAVYYRQDGESIPSPGIIPIAKIDAGTEVFNVPGSVKMTIENLK